MAFEFRLPDIGEGLTEAEVVEWLVAEGDRVALDQPLVQIETDKAVTDIPSPRAGVLIRQGAPAGSVVQVGEVLAVIETADEAAAVPGDAAPIVGTLLEAEASPPQSTTQNEAHVERSREPGTRPHPVEVLPLVRRLARELGVDLAKVEGTGPGGRITREDVESVAGRTATPIADGAEERVRLSKLRRTIASNMERSWREIPHVTTFGDADATAILAVRADTGLALEALFIRAVLPALRTYPEFNASLDGEELVLKRHYDIGVAVDTPNGLLVAVVKAADQRTPDDLSKEIARLSAAVQSRTARPGELTGQTFTISNIGAVGGGHGTPIIPYGTTAILSFGRAAERPVVREGRIATVPVLPLSLSYDHRVIDGALGRRFLDAVVDGLERPSP
jgi:pyruvate dehydrogenase E2 component (dihydrolipoyllysine-residue acetyltransferase)